MFKRPTYDLAQEHGNIMLMFKIMEIVAKNLKEGKKVQKEHLNKIVDFLQTFADKCHHGKEELILFPELVKNPSNKKLVNELLGEHMAGRDFIRGMTKSLDNYEPGNPDALHIAVNAEGYIQLLRQHIMKEGTILFPIANKELSEKVQERVEKQFNKFEEKAIGVGQHEKYHSWLIKLKQTYLE